MYLYNYSCIILVAVTVDLGYSTARVAPKTQPMFQRFARRVVRRVRAHAIDRQCALTACTRAHKTPPCARTRVCRCSDYSLQWHSMFFFSSTHTHTKMDAQHKIREKMPRGKKKFKNVSTKIWGWNRNGKKNFIIVSHQGSRTREPHTA